MMTPTQAREVGRAVGLLDREVDHVIAALGRVPNKTELTVFGGMWSEHCSYKSTRQWLRDLPKSGTRVLAGPGSHAGVVDVGEGWAVAFKIESHNHPSAVEPYQGAATGVGGILRDIIAQGARPCAIMDYLCFGPEGSARVQHLREGIVAGIAGYGNAIGIPNIGGRIAYDPRYEGNPLVNALAAGLVRPDAMRVGKASGVGNAVVLVGASTGRDGILGAAFASEELKDDTTEKRSHVQVGDPYMGKKVMEACLTYTPAMGLVGCQDLGACGIACAIFETAAAGDAGMEIDLGAVPLREDDMSAHEILLSESQERFLFIVQAGREEEALKHFRSFGVHAAVIGRVTEGTRVRATLRGEVVVDLPAGLVAGGAPLTEWPVADALPSPKPYAPFAAPKLEDALLALLGEPGICDAETYWGRYDQTVGNRTVRGPAQAEAAVQKLPDSTRGFALVLSGRGDVCALDPFLGAQAALADGYRALACVGAEAVAITDGLNMGSPRDPVENFRLRETIRGLGAGLEALGLPVTGGNVSLYNEYAKGAIPPTPMVGSLGLVEDVRKVPRSRLETGDVVFLLGALHEEPTLSRYGLMQTGSLEGPAPLVDLAAEKALAALLIKEIRAGRVRGAKAAGLGGLGVALAKLCLRSACGVRLALPSLGRPDWALFGEAPAQAWATTRPSDAAAFEESARSLSVPVLRAGIVHGGALAVDNLLSIPIDALKAAFYRRARR